MSADPALAAMMRRLNPPAPRERIVETDILLTLVNHLSLRDKRVVTLACGHKKVTRAADYARCLECRRMILDGEDYEAFRRGQRGLEGSVK